MEFAGVNLLLNELSRVAYDHHCWIFLLDWISCHLRSNWNVTFTNHEALYPNKLDILERRDSVGLRVQTAPHNICKMEIPRIYLVLIWAWRTSFFASLQHLPVLLLGKIMSRFLNILSYSSSLLHRCFLYPLETFSS